MPESEWKVLERKLRPNHHSHTLPSPLWSQNLRNILKTEAVPNLGHFALSDLVSIIANINISHDKDEHIWFDGKLQVRSGLAEEWINQNHDGLAQKAGCPQEKLNEVFMEHITH